MTHTTTSNIEKAKQEIKKSKDSKKLLIVEAHDDKFNRAMLEYGKFDILLFPASEYLPQKRKNKIKKLDSGLNHVLAKIASKNSVAIGFNLDEIEKLSKEEKAHVLSKIVEIIKICRKSNTTIAVKSEKEVSGFLLSLGASTSQTSKALVF